MSEMIAALSVIFISAGVLLLVANHLSLPTIPFYIIAGFVAGAFVPQEGVLDLAQWGIAFLVFVFGVGVDLPKLSTVFRDSEFTASAQLIVLAPLGYGVGVLFGFDPLNALYFAIAATLSSTLVGTGLLEVEIRNNLVHGRLAKSIHLLDDFVAIALVLVLSASAFTADAVAAKIGYGVLVVLLALIIQRHFFEYLTRYAEGSQELLMIGAISLLIGFLTLSELVGISPVIGAFAAGLAIRRDYTRNLGMLNGIGSIKDFFVVIFFVTLGALVSVPSPRVFAVAAALVVLTAVCKPLITIAALLYEGYDVRTATLTSVSLDQISEFALIIAIQALLIGRIAPDLFDALILAAAFTMVTSSLTRRYDEAVFERVTGPLLGDRQTRKIDEQSSVGGAPTDHVVIVGYGRVGRRLAATCESAGVDYVVIENDPAMIAQLREGADRFVVGDAMYEYVWTKANVGEARIVVSTVDQRRVTDRVLDLDVAAEIVVRSADSDEAAELRAAGASFVIVPDVLASERLEAIVADLLDGSVEADALKTRHLTELDRLEEHGLDSQTPDERPI
ncbi:potassium transporter Kef [Halorubrum sp. JWXQ-INN 858]|uniref:cation:proton antiporter n=1 Tax=Halorubrum sp. JWXQ-INN 858 TaxID=2690782 RepID=UPI00135B9204|nr:cation:proton antiporter [Halorubrum sp. JWXQ-INN 858]MWV65298.1 potassium transporter Kef [Halorubrum sp. JWXQ-INN 858]